MSTKKLNEKELRETNGGSDSSNTGALGASLGIDNLASFSNESHDGDESQKTSTSLGNGINLDSAGILKNLND